MKFFSALFSLLLVFAVVFTTAKPMMQADSGNCCGTEKCKMPKKTKKPCTNDSCKMVCCTAFVAITSKIGIEISVQQESLPSNLILFWNDNRTLSGFFKIFHPPNIG